MLQTEGANHCQGHAPTAQELHPGRCLSPENPRVHHANTWLLLQALWKAHCSEATAWMWAAQWAPQLRMIPSNNTTTSSVLLCQKRFQVLLTDSHSIANTPPGRYHCYTPQTDNSN